MAAHPDDPVGDELDGLLKEPESEEPRSPEPPRGALDAIEEAVKVHRQLAADRPEGPSLNTLPNCLISQDERPHG